MDFFVSGAGTQKLDESVSDFRVLKYLYAESSAPKFDSQFVWHLINEIDILQANSDILGNILTLFFTFCPTNIILMTIFTK